MASVSYNVLTGGNLDIAPSGKKVFINNGDVAATLASGNIDVTNLDIGSGAAVFTGNSLAGSITLGGVGSINASANTITALTELTSTKIQSGAVVVESNNVSGVGILTTDSIVSNNFKVEAASVSGGALLTTMTSDIVRLGSGSEINATSVTTTNVTATGTSNLGGVIIASNNITSDTLTAGDIKTATGAAHMTGGVVTAVTGSIGAVNSTTITNTGTVNSTTLSDGTFSVTGGVLSGATSISGGDVSMTSGTIGHSTLTGADSDSSQIKTSKVIVGDGTISQNSGLATLTGFSTISSATLTTGGAAGTDIINGNVTTNDVTCKTSLAVNSGTANIGAVTFTGGTISEIAEVKSVKFKSGDMEMYTSASGSSTSHKIVGVDILSSSTIQSGGITVTGGSTNSIVGLNDLSSARAGIDTLTSTKVISGSVTLVGDVMTGLSSTTSGTFQTKDGGVVITSASDAHAISGVKDLTMASGGSITCGDIKLKKDTSVIDGVSSATITSSLKVGAVIVQSNNISNVSDVGCTKVTATGNVTAGTFTNNHFKVTHDLGSAKTTTESSVFTTNLTGSGGVTISNNTVSGITDVNTVNLTATGSITGDTLEVDGVTTIKGLLNTVDINNTGTITSGGKIKGSHFEATDVGGTSTIKGDLRVEGDLKVINNSATVIELTHEKMSTRDPVLEFNKILDGGASPSKTVMNVDFGFVNVCYDGSGNRMAGLMGEMGRTTGNHDDIVFKFFHSGTYVANANTVPTGISYAPIQCNNITSDGKLQVGSTTPSGAEKIVTDGDIKCSNIDATGISASGTVTLTSTSDTITSSGKITTESFQTTNFTQTSDARKKENVKTIDDALTNIEKLNPVTFDWKDSKKSDIGFIAQEVREVFPDLVKESDDGHLSVAYTGIVSPLVRAIQQQQEVIRKLEERIAKLEQ